MSNGVQHSNWINSEMFIIVFLALPRFANDVKTSSTKVAIRIIVIIMGYSTQQLRDNNNIN